MTRPRHQRIRIVMLVLAGFAVLGLNVSAADAAAPPKLFRAVTSFQEPPPAGDTILRSALVTVNTGLLFTAGGAPRDKGSLPSVVLNLFPDASFTGLVTRVQQDSWAVTWTGRLVGKPRSYFYLVMADGAFIAHVASTEGVFEVSFAGKGVYRVVQINQAALQDHPEGAMYEPEGDILAPADGVPTADPGTSIDVMVAYTTAARAAEGSTAAMKARIALAVAETNTGYINSGVATRLRLVHVEEVVYTESGNIGTDLTALVSASDGQMDNVHTLRNLHGADMVCLIVENGGGYCGLANAIMATAAGAFQVTARDCATGYYSFGHEFGHLQGARHDMYVDTGTTPYPYGHAYVHPQTTDPAKRWRTIMAYNDRCVAWGYNCTRLQYWSNPSKLYLAEPMGDANSQNYRVLNNTAFTVANFRHVIIGNNFNSTFNTTSTGWNPVWGTWVLSGGAYYQSDGEPNKVSSATYDAKYGDFTYTVLMKSTSAFANRIILRGNPLSLAAVGNWQPSYLFQYANDGRYSVWLISSAGTETPLKNWTTSTAIVPNGWNALKVVAVGSVMKYYINNTLVWTGASSTSLIGNVGFGFYRAAGAATMQVDSATLTNTPTSDLPTDIVEEGDPVPGYDINFVPIQ